MRLQSNEIKEYQQIHYDEYGVQLSYEEAEKQATKLIHLLKYVFNGK